MKDLKGWVTLALLLAIKTLIFIETINSTTERSNVMREVISEAMKREIEEIANSGHADAIIAFGHDMFLRGERKGALIGAFIMAIGGGAGFLIYNRELTKKVTAYKKEVDEFVSKDDFEEEPA